MAVQAAKAPATRAPSWRLLRAEIKVVGAKDAADGDGPDTLPNAALDDSKPLKIEGVANAAIVDRVNEMLDPAGAILDNYLKNPVILADHNYNTAIGTCTDLKVDAQGVHFAADIGRPDLAPLTEDQIKKRSLIAQGILKTVSVGFIPLEMSQAEYDDAGNLTKPAIYTKWELLEISVVSVPCNADSIFQQKEFDLMTTPRARATGSLPMGPAPTSKETPPTSQGEPDGDEPVTGTAGEMLKALVDHAVATKAYVSKVYESMGEAHKKIDSLHQKIDKMGAEPSADPGDAPQQTPSGTDGKPEPVKALEERLTKLEGSIGKLAGAVGSIAEALKATKAAGHL